MRHLFIFCLMMLVLIGCEQTAVSSEPTATLDPQIAEGKETFVRECAACHSLLADTVIVGPTLANIGTVAANRVPNQDAQTYLLISILRPGDHLVDGFNDLMPANYGKRLSGEEIDAIVAYLLTLE